MDARFLLIAAPALLAQAPAPTAAEVLAKGASGADAAARWDQDGAGDVQEEEGPEARKVTLVLKDVL